MPKKVLNKIRKTRAENIIWSQYDGLVHDSDARDHALNLVEATISTTVERHMVLFKQFVVKNPKISRCLGHMAKYPYADAVAGVIRGVFEKQTATQIATNVAISTVATLATYEIGSSLGASIGGAIGSFFSPVGAIVGIYIGGFAGGILATVHAQQGLTWSVNWCKESGGKVWDKVTNFFSSGSIRDNHFNKPDGGPPIGGIYGSSMGANSSLGSILEGGSFGQSNSSLNSLLAAANAHDNLGMGLGEFSAQLTLEGLVSSYNSCNGGQEVTSLGALSGDIGGVATEAG